MLNRIILMGRITKDPELRRTQSGLAVTTVTLAVERDYSSGTERITDFIDVVCWKQTAEFVSNYFSKGRMMVAEGSLQSNKWTDKSGQNRISWQVQAHSVYFGDSKRDTCNTADERDATPGPQYSETEDDGDLLF